MAPIKLHLGCDDDIREGFFNFDPKLNGWKFEHGLYFQTNSVDAITISHALMYVQYKDWESVCSEFYRVLEPGGVIRITEDDCESPSSARTYKPWPGTAVLTGPRMVRAALTAAGFTVHDCTATETYYSDDSLLIAHREHKKPSYVFYIEGVK